MANNQNPEAVPGALQIHEEGSKAAMKGLQLLNKLFDEATRANDILPTRSALIAAVGAGVAASVGSMMDTDE